MNFAPSARRCAFRRALLASTGLAALSQLPTAAQAQSTETEKAVELTVLSDTRTLSGVTLNATTEENIFGVTPNLIAIGVDGGFGNDRITLQGVNNINGTVEKSGDFSLLTEILDVLAIFPLVKDTSVDVYGIEGGFGLNTLAVEGELNVNATAKADQKKLDIKRGSEVQDILPLSLDASVNATSVGLTSSGTGRTSATNSGTVKSTAVAEFSRLELGVDTKGIDLSSVVIAANAHAVGLGGDRSADTLTNVETGSVTAEANANAAAFDIALQGGKLVDVDNATQARASAEAMSGGQSNDTLSNRGELISKATSNINEFGATIALKDFSLPDDILPETEPKTLSFAAATGMSGGLGADRVTNSETGTIDLTAFADYDVSGVEISDGGVSGEAISTLIDHFSPGDDEEDIQQGAIAEIVGLRGDDRQASVGGADMLTNAGMITGTATADSDVISIDIGLPVSEVFGSKKTGKESKLTNLTHKAMSLFGIGVMDYSSDAAALADGVRGGAGNDSILNTGSIDVTADSSSYTLGVSASMFDIAPDKPDSEGFEEPFSLNATVFNTSSNSVAHSVGLSGGDENDTIENHGAVTAHAKANAVSTEVGLAFAYEDKALQIEVPVIFSQTNAVAISEGVDAGDGADTVKNFGSLTSMADASATSTDVTVGLTLAKSGGGINAAMIDKDINASATAVGIRDGLGDDTVSNTGQIKSTATSTATSTSVGIDIDVNTQVGIAVSTGLAKAAQNATARAIGVERVIDDQDEDSSFTSTGDIDAEATATSTRTAVSVDLAYVNVGFDVAAPIISSENIAKAESGALVSFEADDMFTGLSDMSAKSKSSATSTGVGVSGAVSQVGVSAGVSALKSATTAESYSDLLAFGSGDDEVYNRATLLADATATARANDVSVGVGGTTKGLAIGGALVDSATNAIAKATTIATGADNDYVRNDSAFLAGEESTGVGDGEVKAVSLADASSTGVGVSAGAVIGTPLNPGIGVGIGAALSRAGVKGDADALGVDLGGGDDEFLNSDTVTAKATGKARNETVNVALSASMIGGAISGAIADTTIDADADAAGAKGGAGADTLRNNGVLKSDAIANANLVGVAVSGSVAVGFAGGGAGLLGDTTADAVSLGMDGGEGVDTLDNDGDMTVTADADADNASVSVNLNVAPTGVSVGGALVSARTLATSDAVGLSGDDDGLDPEDETTILASENDTVRNTTGELTVTSDATASTVSVAVNGQFNGIGAVAIIADTISDSSAIGLFGGSGNDGLYNGGVVRTTSTAGGSGPSVAVSPFGANIGDINTSATAYSAGMDGGVGDDVLSNSGSLISTATSTVTGELVQVGLIGAVIGDLSTKANATAYGFAGGDGDDTLFSNGSLAATSTANVTGTSVAVNFVGASFADVSTQATARAAAASGGDGDNMFDIEALLATSTSNARSTDVSVVLAGAAFGDSADAATRSIAESYGYLGGDGADKGTIGGLVTINANSDARNDGAAANIAGASFVNTAPEGKAYGAVFDGAAGDDMVMHEGTSTVIADADVTAAATAVSVAGASSAKADPLAEATARGLAGGTGADNLRNAWQINTTADADLNVGRYRITVAGASIGSISSTSRADAAGIDGGADADVIINDELVNSTALAKLKSGGVDVTVFGAGVDTGAGNQMAEAKAAGLRGGAGGDFLSNTDTIITSATASGGGGQVNVTLAGAGLADAKTNYTASAVGIDGEEDNDRIDNYATINSTARVTANTTNTTVTVAGATGGDASVNAVARAALIEGGAGDDSISNYGSLISSAIASGGANTVEVAVGGALLGKAESKTNASGNGLGGGAGKDYLYNAGLLDLNATATGSAGRVSVAVAGSDGGASVETDIQASGTGMSGGDDEDTIQNAALIDMDLTATTTANSTSVVVAGASKINAGLFSTTNGFGLSGDGGADLIINEQGGDIDIVTTASITANSTSVNIAGVSAGGGLLRSRGNATGIAGGDGDDQIFNLGRLYVDANGAATMSGSNFTLTGSASGGGDVKSTATAFGIDGGAGADRFTHSGNLTVRADSTSTAGSSSLSIAGYAGSGGGMGSISRATGIFGGTGADVFSLTGSINVIADARLTANSDVAVSFGASSSSSSPFGVEAYSIGVNGGDDNDLVESYGPTTVTSYSQISTTNSKFAFAGSSSGYNTSRANSQAFGFVGGSGNDLLANYGALNITAEARNTGSGAAGAAVGTTNSASQANAQSSGYAFEGGAGVDTLQNFGQVLFELINSTRTQNSVSSYALFSSGEAQSRSVNTGFGALFYDNSGDTSIYNGGLARITYTGDLGNLRGVSRSEATANGVTVGVGTNARAEARSYSNVTLRGVQLAAGNHDVRNTSTLEARSYARGSAAATGNGNSGINGHGTAIARVIGTDNYVIGVDSTGTLVFENSGTLLALNAAFAAASADANAIGIGVTDPDARATATITLDNARAYGVRSGGGDDRIINSGQITATSQPSADRALARATPKGALSLSVDSFADAQVNINDAQAYGIHAGDGANTIINSGQIVVASNPYAEARSEATGRGPDGDVWARTITNALRAQAYGVITGSGNDYIENTGSITVSANPRRSGSTSVSPGNWCLVEVAGVCIGLGKGEIDRNENSGSTSKTLLAVSTGSGNDTVYNAGAITATGGTAIDLGAGNDTLIIRSGASVSGSVTGGSGTDTLHFIGTLSWNSSGQSFENYTKSGAGTATLSGDNTYEGVTTVEEGVLRINYSASTMTGQLFTSVFGDGRIGQFNTSGTLNVSGGLTVLADNGVYTDGAIYDVVRASSRSGSFSSITLPAPTALRSFSGAYLSNGYRVTANVAPIMSLMAQTSATESSFALALDGASDTAVGGVAETIAVLQSAPEASQVRAAVSAITPKLSTTSMKIASDSMNASKAATTKRLSSRRSRSSRGAPTAALGFAFSEGPKSQSGLTSWAADFSGGSVAPTYSSRLAGDIYGSTRGVDFENKSGALFGFSLTSLQSNGMLFANDDSAPFEAVTASLYGAAPIGEHGFATAMLSFGDADVYNSDPAYQTLSGHSTGLKSNEASYGAHIEAGRSLGMLPGAAELFAALDYQSIVGAASTVDQLDALRLNVKNGEYAQLESEFGLRMSGEAKLLGASLRPHLSLSWVRRYGDGESVTASFADMPDYAFRLTGDLDNRNAARAAAGFNLFAGERYEVSASGIGEFGAEKQEAKGELRATVRF